MSTEEVASIGIGMQTDGVERGIKALDVLASKGPIVEKSMGQVEGAAKRTGKSLENLGQGTALDGLAKTSATAAAGMEKLGASSGKAQAALSGQATAAKSAVSSFDSLKSAVAGFSQTESQYIQKLVDEAKQIGMTRAERERYIAQSRGMSESTQQVAAAIGAKIDAYKREQTELGKTAGATKDSAQSMLAMARTGVAAFLGGAVVQGAMSASKAMFDASASAERLRTMLDFSTGGNSAREIEYLRGVTQRLGLEFSSTAQAYGQFQAAAKGTALEGDKARAVFESVAKASAVMGLSADQSSGVLLALQQMISKGTVQAEELRGQLGERLPGAFQIAAKAMGVTTGELGKMLEQGQVVADDFLPKFAKALEANIGDASEKAAGRLDASVNRVASAWDRLKQNAGDTGASKFMAGQYEILADGLTGVSQAMERARLSGSGFFGQIGSGAVAVARFVNPLQAFSYSAIETGNALKQAEAEFAALQARGAANTKNIYLKDSYFQLQEYIKELKAAQAEQAKLTGGAAGNPNMNAGVTASGQARERFEKQRAADLEAANAFRLNQAGVPASYLKDMAELIRLNQAGVIVGKEYTDALKAQQDTLLKKTGVVKGSAAAANAEQNAYESLISSINAKIEADKLEMAGGSALTESQRIRIKLDQDLAAGRVKLSAQNERAVRLALQELSATEASALAAKTLTKATTDAAASREKYLTSLSTGLDKIQADITAQIEATERMGLSKEAIAELDAAKLEMLATDLELQAIKAMDRNLDQQTYDALKKQAAAYRELGAAKKGGAAKEAALDLEKANAEAAKKAQEDWERAAEQINDTLTDALLRGFESGKGFAENLRQTVVNMFKTMVLRPVISAIINPISGALTGMMGLSGAANAGQSALSTIGTGASIFNAGSALGGLGAVGGAMSGFATAATASVQSLLGMSGTVAQMTTSLAAAGHTAAAGVSAGVNAFQAIPGWGWAIGAVAALAAIFGKKATPHAGAASTYSEAGGLVSGADIYRASGLADVRTYNAGVEQVTGNVAKAIGDTLNATARAFGKTAGYEITTAFADDTSKDGAWGSLIIKQMGDAVIDWRDTQTSKWAPKEFADGEAGSKEYLAEVAKSARDALVQAIGSVDWATDMLKGLGDTVSLESLAQTVQQINAAKVALDQMGKNLVGFSSLTDSAVSALVKAAGGMDGLVSAAGSYYDNFYSEAEKTANVTRDVSAALADVGLAMPKTRQEFRALVEAQMALGESGTKAVATLLGVAGAFASVTAAVRSEQAAERADRLAAQRAQEKQAAEALQKQIQDYADGAEQFNTLRDALLKAGDAAGLLAAVTERAFADPSGTAPKWGANSTAASFNYEYGMQQAAMRQGLSNELSANALRVANVGGALGGLSISGMMGQDDPVIRAVYIGMRDAIVQAAGDAGFAVRDAVDGAALYAAQAQVRGQFSATGPGLASVYAAREAYGLASSNTDVKVYEDAQRKLNGALSSGAIGADQFARALQALNDTLPQAAALSGDFDAQAARAAAALDELAQTGLRSIGYYFGQLNTMALELAKMEEPINATIASIGRLNSFEAAFGVSADAAGATGLSSLQIDRAQIIAEAAGIASAAMTTADAAAAAAKLAQSPAFAELGAKGIRDAALLLDGVGEYNADGFERAFIRISDALATGSVTEGQYKALFDTALGMFNGVPEETRTLIDSMTRLRDAMSGFADGLLIDEQRTTLSAGATLAEMQRQYAQAFAGASTGDNEAIGKYQQLATTLLDKNLYGSQAEYNAAFGSVYGDARQLETIGVNTLANAQGNEMVSELKDMNAKLNKRVEDLEKNLLAALAQIAKNTSDTSRGIEQQIVMAEETQ